MSKSNICTAKFDLVREISIFKTPIYRVGGLLQLGYTLVTTFFTINANSRVAKPVKSPTSCKTCKSIFRSGEIIKQMSLNIFSRGEFQFDL